MVSGHRLGTFLSGVIDLPAETAMAGVDGRAMVDFFQL
jgi:hypothetical protein